MNKTIRFGFILLFTVFLAACGGGGDGSGTDTGGGGTDTGGGGDGDADGDGDGDGDSDSDGTEDKPYVLTDGLTVTVPTMVAGEELWYSLDVSAGQSFWTQLSGGSGDIDMIVEMDDAEVCASLNAASDETCEVAVAESGSYIIRLVAYSSATGVDLMARTAGGPAASTFVGSADYVLTSGTHGGSAPAYIGDTASFLLPDTETRFFPKNIFIAKAEGGTGMYNMVIQVNDPLGGRPGWICIGESSGSNGSRNSDLDDQFISCASHYPYGPGTPTAMQLAGNTDFSGVNATLRWFPSELLTGTAGRNGSLSAGDSVTGISGQTGQVFSYALETSTPGHAPIAKLVGDDGDADLLIGIGSATGAGLTQRQYCTNQGPISNEYCRTFATLAEGEHYGIEVVAFESFANADLHTAEFPVADTAHGDGFQETQLFFADQPGITQTQATTLTSVHNGMSHGLVVYGPLGDMPAGTVVEVSLSGGTGDADLVLHPGIDDDTVLPYGPAGDGCASRGTDNTESCTMTLTGQTVALVRVFGFPSAENVTATVKVTLP